MKDQSLGLKFLAYWTTCVALSQHSFQIFFLQYSTSLYIDMKMISSWASSNAATALMQGSLLIVTSHIADEKFQTFEFQTSSVAPWFGQQTVDHTQQSPEPCNTQQTLQRAATANKFQPKPSSADENMKSKWPSSDEGQP